MDDKEVADVPVAEDGVETDDDDVSLRIASGAEGTGPPLVFAFPFAFPLAAAAALDVPWSESQHTSARHSGDMPDAGAAIVALLLLLLLRARQASF
jgi:hypothetical protein